MRSRYGEAARRVAQGSPLKILNANAAIAWDAMKAGSAGFNGVFTNFHPDLYKWLREDAARDPALAEELATFLVLAAVSESLGYPALAKIYHQRIGTFELDSLPRDRLRRARTFLGTRCGARQDRRRHRAFPRTDRRALRRRAAGPAPTRDGMMSALAALLDSTDAR